MLDTKSPLKALRERLMPKGMIFRRATPDDAGALVELYRDFFSRSKWHNAGFEFDELQARHWLETQLKMQPLYSFLVAEHKGELVGVICHTYDLSFWRTMSACLHSIYVRPAYRFTAVGRTLLTSARDRAERDGACNFIVNIASGMGAASSLVNLLLKIGFTPFGVSFFKRFP